MRNFLKNLWAAVSSKTEAHEQNLDDRLARKEREKKVRELLRLLNRKKSLWTVPPVLQKIRETKDNIGFVFIEHEDDRDQPFDFVARLRSLSDEATDLKTRDGLNLEKYGWPNKENIRCSLSYNSRPFGVSTDGDLFVIRDWAATLLPEEQELSDGAAIAQLLEGSELLLLSFSLEYDKRHLKALQKHIHQMRNAVADAKIDSAAIVLVHYSVSQAKDVFVQQDDKLQGAWGQHVDLDDSVPVGVISHFDRIGTEDFDRWHELVEPRLMRSKLWTEHLGAEKVKESFDNLLIGSEHPWMRDVQRAVEKVLVASPKDTMRSGQ